MSVIVKKDGKIQATLESLETGFSFEQFLAAFQSQYPKDCEKVQREYAKHERKTKPGKTTIGKVAQIHPKPCRKTWGHTRRIGRSAMKEQPWSAN